MPVTLSTPVRFLKRVGDRIAANLAKRGIETVEDLLYHLPFRYEDRSNPTNLALAKPGDMASLVGDVRGSALLQTRGPALFELTLGLLPAGDAALGFGGRTASQPTIKCLWFNGHYLRERFHPGQLIAVYGKLEASRSGGSGRFKLMQPQFEILPDRAQTAPRNTPEADFARLEMNRILPVYESLGGTTAWGAKLTSKWTRRLMWSIFEDLAETPDPEETLPTSLRERLQLPTRIEALRQIHFPESGTSLADLQNARTPAHRRLIFEEFFFLELGLSLKRRRLQTRPGTAFETGPNVREALKQILPFHPTPAQKRVLAEIVADMRRPRPMRRLLQGDVGSGKTIVALQSALVAIENGLQSALMAPTEILATQHYLSARKLLEGKLSPRTGRPYRITLLTGSLDEALKREARGRIARGETDLILGTHALIQDSVEFARLGLVIVDEQHRFGVQQRFKLIKSGAPGTPGDPTPDPDVLVMTATPIPRTLALTLYRDLDLSVLDELPPGRTPILTRRTPAAKSPQVWDFLRKQIAQGHQAYIVYPIIEGSRPDAPDNDQPELDFAPEEKPEQETVTPTKPTPARSRSKPLFTTEAQPRQKLRSATEMYDELRRGPLANLRLGLLHGRMSADEKDIAMRRFARGDLDVLIATTVIEVGVDVPNASIIVIDHAERFGLAQLHQLRGRVGRGAAKSYCILLTGEKISESAETRLAAMAATQDGFALAELDLQQRGPGEFFGTRQAGLPDLRVANLLRDRELLDLARAEATRLAETPDPTIPEPELEAVRQRLKHQWQRRYGLLEA